MSEPLFEELHTEIPGPRTRELAVALRTFESRNVTFVDEEFPVFWERSSGATVTDVDGNRYIDLTAGFGVANTGHSNPRVARALSEQASRLMHAMGDVHPNESKTQLLELLAQIAPGDLSKTFLASTGAEAVEAAMKTAVVATGKSAFAAFENAYHGLTLGSLTVSGIAKFREPFAGTLPQSTLLLPYPRDGKSNLAELRRALQERADIAALFVEPVQGRGGNIVPPKGWLNGLREICTDLGILLVFDEIYTGFGRTGTWFACEDDGAVPDIMCIGKALANGFPMSAAIARPDIMDAWPVSAGEALHTSTYLGNPMGCAAAVANIGEMQRMDLPEQARMLGLALSERLERLRTHAHVRDIRGRGLMWAIELDSGERAARVVKQTLRAGIILLQAGPQGEALSLTPPLVITKDQLFHAIDII
ncbi:MAG TPA: aspartate aminotransferase family protein, partial [Candidatus Baltobacteraceae bacterium]|nr:aspartate aminotransferase family protein [Candidatus Baltobacteraceae bacterium]